MVTHHFTLSDRFPEAAPAVVLYDSADRFDPGRRYDTTSSVTDATSAVPANDTERQAEAARATMITDLSAAWRSPAVLSQRSEPRTLASSPAAPPVRASDEAAAEVAHAGMVRDLCEAWRSPGGRR